MAARAIWKAVLRIDELAVPVKLYSAIEDRAVHFRLLSEDDRVPVRQRMVEPGGREVAMEEVRRGFETGPGRFVVLDEDELAELAPEPSRDVTFLRFVPRGSIGHQWYDRPYWLGPDGDAQAYFALARALREEESEGIARWTMRKRDYQGALRPEGEHLVLVTLRHAAEIVSAASLPAPAGRALGSKEVRMAEQLIDALAGDWDPTAFHDEHRERVRELIAAKADGKTIPIRRARRKKEPESLERALAESLDVAKKGRKSA